MQLPSWNCYCPNTTEVNALVFHFGGLSVWFSYKTPIAFQLTGHNKVIRENTWGPTTGKHINAVDNGPRKDRVDGVDFMDRLKVAMEEM